MCAARDVRCRTIRLSVDSVASVISRLVCAQLVMYDAEPFVCLLTLFPVLSRGLCVRSSCCTMQSHSSVC